jgi:hypothetical protein
MLRTYYPGVGLCDVGYIANAKQKAKDAANNLVFYSCVSNCYDLSILNGGNPASAPSFFINGGSPNSTPTCFINGGSL